MTFKHVVYSLPVIALAATSFAGFVLAGSKAQAQSVRLELAKHEADEADKRTEIGKSVTEFRNDVRALYRFMATGVPQPRLAAPLPEGDDLGPPVAKDGQ